MPAPEGKPDGSAEAIIVRDKIVDLTGKSSWDVPPGKWSIIRFGYSTIGTENKPVPQAGLGLECDKFSKTAAGVMSDGLMGKLIADNGKLVGENHTLVSTHIDSWEVGSQNWTPLMMAEFKDRRGYDLLPFLPVLMGRIVDSAAVTERFSWDFRQTVSDLIVDNYAGEFRRLAKIEELVEDGATIIGRPPSKSPSLAGYPSCDQKIAEAVQKLWGATSPAPSGARAVGKGRVIWGRTAPEVLADAGVKPDFTASLPIRYIHRVVDDMDVYFVANPNPQSAEAVCTFRVTGKTPQVWFPETGRIESVSVFEENDGCTIIPLKSEPAGSEFIVFRKGAVKL